ncbi:MAG: PqqD family peptide modification chaperone [Boseongicola sp.]
MTTPRYLTFTGIGAPLSLRCGEDFVDLIRTVLPGWPFQLSDTKPETSTFFHIDHDSNGSKFRCQDTTISAARPRILNAVDAVCDLIAAISRALPAAQPTLICLHAAAIEVSGRLIVIPNARRSGKSTLAACLAQHGCPIFSDDFLAISFDAEGRLVGRANGICPRLRIPLPESLPTEFTSWALSVPGPSNKQYKYLSLDGLPESGNTLPLGAIVLIDRSEEGTAEFGEISPDDAMEVLLHQNFTRDIHSGGVLTVMERLLATLPTTRLCYSNASEAAAGIIDKFGTWTTPIETNAALAGQQFHRATDRQPLQGAINPGNEYSQKQEATAATIGEAVYISDPNGAGIHRLDPISRAIWLLLGEPITPDQIVDILQFANPKVPNADIRNDTIQFLNELAHAGLLVGKTG